MNILAIIREFSLRHGLSQPTAIVLSRDVRVQQCLGKANEVIDDLFVRKLWSKSRIEATFATTGTDTAYNLSTICNQGFQGIINGTLFNRTSDQQILGPITPQEWQQIKAGLTAVSLPHYRLDGSSLRIWPVPTSGETIALEYKSSYPIQDNSTSIPTYKQYFTNDTDTCIYPDHIILAGLSWLWRSMKGMRYAEQKQQYELAIAQFAGADGGARALDMAEDPFRNFPGIVIPDRNWSV